MHKITKIPVNINDPECPRIVIDSDVADSIYTAYSDAGVSIPDELINFVEQYPRYLGYEWQAEVMRQLDDENIPIELIERWLNIMPSGLCRAEIRAIFKNRLIKIN
jgi:hypothetical protein